MSDMPSAREHALYDLRRKRAGILTSGVLGASFAVFAFTGQIELIALAIAAALAFFAVPSWVGVEPRYPIPKARRAVLAHLSSFAVPAVGVALFYVMWSRGKFEELSFLPTVVVAAGAYAIYRWQHLAAALARVRGDDEGMSVLSRLWRHYLGYAAGLSAGLVAAALLVDPRQWAVSLPVFASVFLAVKLVIDLSLPQPPLAPRRLSATFFTLALMSPIWFGLPWGVALASASALFDLSLNMSLASAVDDSAMIVVYITVASAVVFAALATAAAVMDLATGEG